MRLPGRGQSHSAASVIYVSYTLTHTKKHTKTTHSHIQRHKQSHTLRQCQSHSRASVIRVIHTHTHKHTYKDKAQTAGSAYVLLIPHITRFTIVPFESMIHFIQFTHSLYDICDQCDGDDEQSGTTNNYNAFLAAV